MNLTPQISMLSRQPPDSKMATLFSCRSAADSGLPYVQCLLVLLVQPYLPKQCAMCSTMSHGRYRMFVTPRTLPSLSCSSSRRETRNLAVTSALRVNASVSVLLQAQPQSLGAVAVLLHGEQLCCYSWPLPKVPFIRGTRLSGAMRPDCA